MFKPKQILVALSILLNVEVFHGSSASNSREICVEQPRDLFLVVDDSSSIDYMNFLKVRRFLSKLASAVHVSRDMTRLGFLQFSDEKNIHLRFNLDDIWDAKTEFGKMKYGGGSKTMTDLALKTVVEKVFTKTGGDRPDVPDIVVLFTDGKSRHQDRTIEQANRLKNQGVRIICIGSGYDQAKVKEELLKIASSPSDVKMVNFANLDSIVVDIVSKVCTLVTTTKPPTTITEPRRKSPRTFDPKTRTQKPRIRAPAPGIDLASLNTQPSASTTLAPIGCAGTEGKDVLFLIDGTVSYQKSYDLSEKDFKKVKKFIKGVIRELGDGRFRVGVMQYTGKDTARMEIDFMSPLEMLEIKFRLGTIVQKRGYKRSTGDALVKANNQFYELDALSQREKHSNVIVLLTRGIADDKKHAVSSAMMLESRNIRLITVGLGPYNKHLATFLHQMTNPKYIVMSKYSELKTHGPGVVDAMCDKTPVLPNAGLPRQSAECRRFPHDIFFVIDGSASIKYFNFEKVQIFLMDLISLLRVDASDINTGLMQFSKAALTSMVWDLGRYSESETIMNIRNMKYQSGKKTRTGDALTRVNNEVFNGRNGDRAGITDILILFTDGNAHDYSVAREQAKILKEKGVLVVTIGAGSRYTLRKFEKELNELASSPEYAMKVNFDDLDVFAEKAFPLVCRYLRRRRL